MKEIACPACGGKIRARQTRLLGSSHCIHCQSELVIAEPESTFFVLIGLLIAALSLFAAGARNLLLVLGLLVLAVPAHALVVAVFRTFFRYRFSVAKGPWRHTSMHDQS